MNTPLPFRCRGALLCTAAILTLAVPATWADDDDSDEQEIPFEEAELFLEFNSTDEDLGIHISVDGDAWKELELEGPNGRKLLQIDARSRLRRQGLTQLFIESAEPTFDELEPAEFFARFPEGEYEVGGTSLDGEELESIAELTHLIPAAVKARVNTLPADEDCEIIDVAVAKPVVIEWDEVLTSFADPRFPAPASITVHNYEVVVEAEVDDLLVKTSTILPPDARSYAVPNEFIDLSDVWKFEVLVREASSNQTSIESCFVIN